MSIGQHASRIVERRQNARVCVTSLLYASKMAGGVPIVLDLSLGGLAIQAMEVLERGTLMEFQFTLPQIRTELSGVAEIVWSDKTGRAGLKFIELSYPQRLRLQQWVIENRLN